MEESFLLNPATKRRARRARRSKARGRRRSYRIRRSAPRRSVRRARRSGGRRRRVVRVAARRSGGRRRRRRNPLFEAGLGLANPSRRRRRRRTSLRRSRGSRRRNPGGGGSLGGALAISHRVLPFSVPLPGIIGKVVNGALQATGAGGVVFLGYQASGFAVDKIESAMGATFANKWRRPLLFAGLAGLTGWAAAKGAKILKGNAALWAILAAAGPGIRAFGGIIKNLIGAEATGFLADVRNTATQLSDFLQIQGPEDEVADDEGMDDFIQMGDEEVSDDAFASSEEELAGAGADTAIM